MALESLKQKYRVLHFLGYIKWKIRLALFGNRKSKVLPLKRIPVVVAPRVTSRDPQNTPHTRDVSVLRLKPIVEPGFKLPVICDVFIPCHQEALEFLPESIRSILNQSSAHCIVHVAFDGEFEGQMEIIKQFPQVRFYYSKNKIGQFRIANELTQYCESHFFANQDADDISLPHRIWSGVSLLQKYQYNFLAANMEQFVDYRYPSEEGIEKLMKNPYHISGKKWQTCSAGALVSGTLIGRLESFKKINGYGGLLCSADDDLGVRLHHEKEKIIFLDQIVSLRRLHSKSVTLSDYRLKSQARLKINEVLKERENDLLRGQVTASELGKLGSQIKSPTLIKMNHPLFGNENTNRSHRVGAVSKSTSTTGSSLHI